MGAREILVGIAIGVAAAALYDLIKSRVSA